MQSISEPVREQASTLRADSVGGTGGIFCAVLDTFERAGMPYCILSGYENYPERIKSDVDCVISHRFGPRQVLALLHENRNRIGADVVRFQGCYIVLAGKNPDASTCFLKLDLCVDFEAGGRKFLDGGEVLDSRRRHERFWVPAPRHEFVCYLLKKIAKGQLTDEQGRRLSALYRQDPAGCRQQVARFWSTASAALVGAAADADAWAPVRRSLGLLAAEARRRATWRRPWQALGYWVSRAWQRMRRYCRPDAGLEVVFLGPDGAGKSSVVQGTTRALADVFSRVTCCRFPPAVLSRLLRRPEPPPEKRPHGSPPRSLPHSVLRAVCYWFGYCGLAYPFTVQPALARATLVLHDRHIVDALVDPRRYRYGGPLWLLRLLWRLVPKPDLVILLDAPPEVLQARKQEVPLQETARQRDAYRALVGSIAHGRVVDVNRPLWQVTGDVGDLVLDSLSRRIRKRLGLENEP